MTKLFLGLIALSVLVMAVIQVAAIVFALSAARRIGAAADRIERDLRPVVQNLEAITADAAKATSLTVAQMERADRLVGDVTRRLDHLLAFLPGVLGPAGKGVAFIGGLKAVLAAIREIRRAARSRKRPTRADDKDAFFTG